VRSLEFSPPPRRLLFLHRKLGGIFQLLRRLDLELDLQPYWVQMVESERARAVETRSNG
jgi:aarF domain-containing kinase